jgi:DNA-binding Xre family transcriptional regulator
VVQFIEISEKIKVYGMKSRLRILMAEKSTREDKRITLRDIHNATGVGMHTLQGMSKGTIKTISIDALDTLARYFDCSLDDLFYREESGNTVPVLAAA